MIYPDDPETQAMVSEPYNNLYPGAMHTLTALSGSRFNYPSLAYHGILL